MARGQVSDQKIVRLNAARSQQTDSTDMYMALVDFVYRFAAESESPDDAADLLMGLDQMGLNVAELDANSEMQAHLDRALKIAERISVHVAKSDEPHPLDNQRIYLSARFEVMSVGQQALAMIAPYCDAITLGQPLKLIDKASQRDMIERLTLIRRQSDGPHLLRLQVSKDSDPLLIIANSVDDRETLCLTLLTNENNVAVDEDITRDLGLTKAESTLIHHLQLGKSLKEAAIDIGVAHNTARNHLKSVFAKVGVNRQGDLLQFLTMLRLAAPDTNGIRRPLTEDDFDAEHIYRHPNLITLSDGNVIAYHIFGSAVGLPVLAFNSPLIEFLAGPKMNASLHKLNLCLVCIQRPGYGQSTFQPDYSFAKFRQDVREVLTVLQKRFRTKRFPIYSFAGGARMAIETAIACGDDISAIGMVGPRVTAEPDELRGFATQIFYQLSKSTWAMDFVVRVLATRATERFVRAIIERWVMESPVDRELLNEEPDLFQQLIKGSKIALAETPDGVSHFLKMMASDEGILWDRVTQPAIIWDGEKNGTVAHGSVEAIAEKLPNCTLTKTPNAGQLTGTKLNEAYLVELLKLDAARREVAKV